MDDIKEKKEGLLDTLHKCIMCNATAYEVKDDKYECSRCDFEWEVLNCE